MEMIDLTRVEKEEQRETERQRVNDEVYAIQSALLLLLSIEHEACVCAVSY